MMHSLPDKRFSICCSISHIKNLSIFPLQPLGQTGSASNVRWWQWQQYLCSSATGCSRKEEKNSSCLYRDLIATFGWGRMSEINFSKSSTARFVRQWVREYSNTFTLYSNAVILASEYRGAVFSGRQGTRSHREESVGVLILHVSLRKNCSQS